MLLDRGGMRGWQAGARAPARLFYYYYLVIKCEEL